MQRKTNRDYESSLPCKTAGEKKKKKKKKKKNSASISLECSQTICSQSHPKHVVFVNRTIKDRAQTQRISRPAAGLLQSLITKKKSLIGKSTNYFVINKCIHPSSRIANVSDKSNTLNKQDLKTVYS